MQYLLGKFPPKSVDTDTIWIATQTQQVGRGASSIHFQHTANWVKRGRWGSCVFDFATALIARQSNLLTRQEALDHIYLYNLGGPEFGGPETALKALDVFVCRLRKILPALGLNIFTRWGYGWELEVLPWDDVETFHKVQGASGTNLRYSSHKQLKDLRGRMIHD